MNDNHQNMFQFYSILIMIEFEVFIELIKKDGRFEKKKVSPVQVY